MTLPYEPVNIQSAEFRKHLVWFVDECYGQHGVKTKEKDSNNLLFNNRVVEDPGADFSSFFIALKKSIVEKRMIK
ncbi:hypothetical protein [Fictibacillus barbaricus]|uniref:Uncharacterized protein n=1 Tax=Fictibacillus barbaricus TaxID=182136 RepID=A0ABS2ZBB8_9BACL|nr:hypothetical protein [Fictibacillus barbaricus]MBN3545500.1 hypothetical protein [Fictibacillus barbaricus]GGB53926.1 hypothetical protein GCM10007199_19520 [Fictibacillus barbaricus]